MLFEPDNGRQFNNPDSFAMAFDDAWKRVSKLNKTNGLNQKDKIDIVFETLKDHPFIINNIKQARDIAIFRINLLGLN